MANNKEEYRVSCNEVNCAESELNMPKEGRVASISKDRKNILLVFNSAIKGFVPEEIALGMKIEATGDKPKEQQEQASKESR